MHNMVPHPPESTEKVIKHRTGRPVKKEVGVSQGANAPTNLKGKL
jgi:hypothetical protein